MDGLVALATYDASTYSAAASQQLALNLSDTLENIVYISQLWEQEAVDHASIFAGAVSQIMGLIKPAIDALNALAEYDGSRSILFNVLDFARRLSEVVVILKAMASQYDAEGYQAAAVFFGAAKAIVEIVKPGLEAIGALVDADLSRSILFNVLDFARRLSEVVVILGTMGARYEVEGYQAANTFYQAAKGIVDIVQPGIDAIAALTEYEPVQSLAMATASFAESLLEIVFGLEEAARGLAAEGYTAAGAFYQSAGQIVNIVKPGIDAMTALFDYRPVEELPATLARFTGQLFYVIDELNRLAGGYEAEGYAAASAFYQAAGELVGI
ncbi:MAG TPA: hypothetical protein PLT23_08570, partial [Lentisphaeria bacterium]|nr:hypothetical protein [Lentisphaeria bacterium]